MACVGSLFNRLGLFFNLSLVSVCCLVVGRLWVVWVCFCSGCVPIDGVIASNAYSMACIAYPMDCVTSLVVLAASCRVSSWWSGTVASIVF